MTDIIRERFTDIFGTLDEKGGWLGGGNGVAEAGEKFKYKGTKYELKAEDVSSYEGFAAFLERITSAKVDALRNNRGGIQYFVYRHKQNGARVVDPNSNQDIFNPRRVEDPDLGAFKTSYASKMIDFTNNCDASGVLELLVRYDRLVNSAAVYAPEVRDYRKDWADFDTMAHLNAGDVEGFLGRTADYNREAGAYYAAKDFFYLFYPTNRCAPQYPPEPRPIPPSNPRPIPPSEPVPIPDEDGNNPDEVEDI